MDIKLGENAEILINILNGAGFQGYAVGGYVRDSVMKIEPYDLDIATDATVEEMLKLFSDFRCLTQGAKHGTVAVIVSDDTIECTTYRIDGEYSDGRHPDSVTFSPRLIDDLSRRDFTVNALAFNSSDGLIDLFGGLNDIENRIIRAIGDPDKRFNEDALRIMRAMRFASDLNFSVQDETAESMKRNANRLSLVSSERITAEFEKLIVGENIRYVLENFGDILSAILGEIRLDGDIINTVERCPKEFDLRLFALISKCDEPMSALENSRLIIRKADKKTIAQLSQMKQLSLPIDRKDLKQLMSRFDISSVEKYLRFSGSDLLLEQMSSVLQNDECFSLAQLKIGGERLEQLGFHGREIQLAKEKILGEIIDGKLQNDEAEILNYLKAQKDSLR